MRLQESHKTLGAGRLTVCMDDLGLNACVNNAGLALLSQGRLQAISCLVGAPAWLDVAPTLRGLGPRQIDLGLHLDLTQFPLSIDPQTLGQIWRRGVLDREWLTQIKHEIGCQIELFEDSLGHSPDYIDGHQHIHQFPGVRDVLIRVLQQRGLKDLWIRNTYAPSMRTVNISMGVSDRIKPKIIQALGQKALSKSAVNAGFFQNKHLLGVYPFTASVQRYKQWVSAWLQIAENGDVLMCHPALGAGHNDSIALARTCEAEVLASTWLQDLLQEKNLLLSRLARVSE